MSFPVWKVKVKDISEALDIALTRTERSFGSGHRDFEISSIGVNVEEESLRRDFTINALYLEIMVDSRNCLSVQLHDFHEGLKSILKREIRCVKDAEDRFNEDPLRMLRAIRFEAKLGFSIEKKTSQAIHRLMSSLLGTVAAERIADELYRSLVFDPEIALDEFYSYGVFQEICQRSLSCQGMASPNENTNEFPREKIWSESQSCSDIRCSFSRTGFFRVQFKDARSSLDSKNRRALLSYPKV